MKNILITACGGAPAINFTRSLRDADPKRKKYTLIGIDCNKYTLHRGECDVQYLGPKADHPKYIDFLLEIIKREKIAFLHSQPEAELFIIGQNREKIEATGCKLYLPAQKSIEILRDKFLSYEVWAKKGITVPKNIKIDSEADLLSAYKELNGKIWIRETIGAAGKGSFSNPTFQMAKAWIDGRDGWGKTVAAEHLTARTTTWQSVWENGKLVAGQGRERLYWEAGNRAQSGVTGITGTGKTIKDPAVSKLAIECIKAVDEKPHGIFSVDFTYNEKGIPNPTEINIAKFFTTHHFITRTGCNMPEMIVELAFGEYKGKYDIIDPCKENMYWIRGVDSIPVLKSQKEIDAAEREFEKTLSKLS